MVHTLAWVYGGALEHHNVKFHEKNLSFMRPKARFHDFGRNIVGHLEITGNTSSYRYSTYIWVEDEEILTYVVHKEPAKSTVA